MTRALALLLAALSAGCLGPPSFICHADAQCGADAFCEADGHCSARDTSCPSRRRYLLAGGDRANACVASTCAANPIVALAAGSAHACVLRQSGQVTCWGRNADGQLGDGTRTPRSIGVPVAGLGDAVAIAAGDRHTCAVRAGGGVLCWGADDTGQLGDGGGGDHLAPVEVPGVTGAVAVEAGLGFSCALLADQTAVCWGDNRNGEIGDGTPGAVPRAPTPVTGLSGARALSAHWQHACAILNDQSLVCWGNNATGQIGDGTLVNRPQPAPVAGLRGVTAVAAGLSHTCALASGGLSCWGSNSQGQLGTASGPTTAPVTAPVAVALLPDPIAVAAGAQHTCAVRSAGQVLCWGQNGTGQLGEGSMSSLAEPVPVTGLDTGAAVVAGATFSCATTTDGAVLCWGDDHDGQLGTGRGVVQPAPVALAIEVTGLSTGGAHSCGVTSSGFSCWGSNQAGQLGDNQDDDRARPAPIELPLVPGAVAAGALHSCAADATGGLWCWGRGSGGQIGPGRSVDTPFPIAVPLPAGTGPAVSVTTGDSHTCVVLSGAAGAPVAACFGANDHGQLGDGTTGAHAAPAAIALPGGASTGGLALSAGGAHTCAVDAAGHLWCWGRGDRGQLGTGAAADDPTPAPVTLPAGTAALVSAGQAHTCAVDRDAGQVWCWGANDRGQLGFTGPAAPLPVLVAGLPGPADGVSAGGAHSCASLHDGRVFCWGANESGQLGDGATLTISAPQLAQLACG